MKKELTLPAKVESIPEITAFVDEMLEAADCPMKVQMQINIAIDELFGNIAFYAYAPDTGEATVSLEITEEPHLAVLSFIDRGKPYNPMEKKDPDVTLSAEERDIGGLGIYMVKKSMTAMEYVRENGQNILTIKKLLD